MQNTDWVCIGCGGKLGKILGGEYYPGVPPECIHTSGPNLMVTCPDCGRVKVFYTSDPVVRAVYQLVDAIATVAAKAMVEQIGKNVHSIEKSQ